MSLLLSAPEPVGQWTWDIDAESDDNLERGVHLIPPIARVLRSHGLLDLSRVQVSWHTHGQGATRFSSLVSVYKENQEPSENLLHLIMESRPSVLPNSYPGRITLLGSGTWIDADGRERIEERLALVTLLTDTFWVHLTLEVQHDIWAWFDFSGTPHPEIYQKNAPRLSSALQEIEEIMGVETEPGNATFFGTSEKYGVKTPKTKQEGSCFDARIRL